MNTYDLATIRNIAARRNDMECMAAGHRALGHGKADSDACLAAAQHCQEVIDAWIAAGGDTSSLHPIELEYLTRQT